MRRVHVYISGDVQGVFFRAEARGRARERGVTGWIRNLRDGRVEAIFEGQEDAVGALTAWCREGPRGARVTEVDVEEEEPEGLAGFEVRRTPA